MSAAPPEGEGEAEAEAEGEGEAEAEAETETKGRAKEEEEEEGKEIEVAQRKPGPRRGRTSEARAKKSREELLLSLRVLSGAQDWETPPNVARMLKDYNSLLTQEMKRLKIVSHPEARGVKRTAPGPYPNSLNEDDVQELQQFVDENGGNIKKLRQMMSFLEELDELGKKAMGRLFSEGEKGGCNALGIPITKESLRESVYAVLFEWSGRSRIVMFGAIKRGRTPLQRRFAKSSARCSAKKKWTPFKPTSRSNRRSPRFF